MSTTDTIRAAFVAAKAKMIRTGDGWTDFEMFEAGHKAATEAAKATGTAGEQETHNFEICMYFDNWLISKGFASTSRTEDVDGPMAPAMNWIDAVEAAIEAARQPAPVVAVSLTTDQKRELLKCLNGGVEMGWIEQNNALEISSSILAGAQDQKLPVLPVKTWQERVKRTDDATAMKRRSIVARDEEIADLRAAMAATAAPVLSDERIDWLANCACPGGIAYPSQVKTAIRDALREAATNRSQP